MRWKGGSVGCIEPPGPGVVWQVYQFRQPCRERRSRHRARTEAGEMRGFHLAVDLTDIPLLQLTRKTDQRDLGGIGFAAEHRYAVEHPADRHTVAAADQTAVTPGFHRMRIAGIELAGIGRELRRRDPGAAGPFAGFGARPHHIRKRGVDAHLEAAISDAIGEGAGHANLRWHEHHARIGTPTLARLTGVEPW